MCDDGHGKDLNEKLWFKVSAAKHPDFKTPFSNPNSGQEKHGGHDPKGTKRHLKFIGLIKAARKKDTGKEFEEAILKPMVKKNDILATACEEHCKLKGKKAKKKEGDDRSKAQSGLLEEQDSDDESIQEFFAV